MVETSIQQNNLQPLILIFRLLLSSLILFFNTINFYFIICKWALASLIRSVFIQYDYKWSAAQDVQQGSVLRNCLPCELFHIRLQTRGPILGTVLWRWTTLPLAPLLVYVKFSLYPRAAAWYPVLCGLGWQRFALKHPKFKHLPPESGVSVSFSLLRHKHLV